MSTSEQMSCQGMCGCLGPGEQYQRERVRWLGNMPTETEMKRDGYFPMGFKSLGKVPSYHQFQWGRSDNTYASRKVVQLPQTPQSRSYFQEAAQPVTLEFCGCKMECTGSSCQGIVQPSSARCTSIAKAWQIPNKTKCAGPTGVLPGSCSRATLRFRCRSSISAYRATPQSRQGSILRSESGSSVSARPSRSRSTGTAFGGAPAPLR